MSKWKKVADTTNNSRVYKLAIKRHREITGDISCSYCPYNRGENQKDWVRRSWKIYRKTQYKGV